MHHPASLGGDAASRNSYTVPRTRGGKSGVSNAWAIAGFAVAFMQLVVALAYALTVSEMPKLVHVRGLGLALFCAAVGSGVLGLAAALLRSRPIINAHLMASVLALALAMTLSTHARQDTATFCNIITLDMNLHAADQHIRQMHNTAIMENLAARLQELDRHMLAVPDVAHAAHKSEEAQQQLLTRDYGIIHKKLSAMRRHAGIVQEQVLRVAKEIKQAVNETAESEGEGEDSAVVLSKEQRDNLDKLKEIFEAADTVLQEVELPRMQQGRQGRLDPSLSLPPEAYLPLLHNLTAAAESILAIESSIRGGVSGSEEDGAQEADKGAFFNAWRRVEREQATIAAADDDYLDDYDLTGGMMSPLEELHEDAEAMQEVLRRYKHNMYRMEASNEHADKIRKTRGDRNRARDRFQAEFEAEIERAESDHERILLNWNRDSATCQEAGSIVPRAVAVSLTLLGLQGAASYVSLSLMFQLPTKRTS